MQKQPAHSSVGPCSVTIARKQLYIVNGQIFCKDRCQVPNPDLDELAKSVKSFDILA